jgi:pimeloyl-ACP methyl ester carboxylesterase
MQTRAYGNSGAWVIVLHGGPGAAGYMAPVARGLADSVRVLEPFQRGSGDEPLTVARHVADLHELVRCEGARPAIVGHSWGAMLALSYAAAHPDSAGPLVLIGCGTFDPMARERLHATVEERTDGDLRARIERLTAEVPDPDERLRVMGELILPLYSYDLATSGEESELCDARAQDETWRDMVRLQREGVYPAAFAAIKTPVLMLHGAFDPHPGQMIRASLEPFLPQLEYREFERCGHYPWLERSARDEFFSVMRDWLARRLSEGLPTRRGRRS